MLVPAICPNCGATLKIDDTKEAAVCTYCQTPFISEKSIQNFNIQNTINIQNATIINQEESEDTILRRGITQLKIGHYDEAKATLTSMSKKFPNCWKCWYGLAMIDGYSLPLFELRMEESIKRIVPTNVLSMLDEENAPVEETVIASNTQKITRIMSENQSEKNEIDKLNGSIEDNTYRITASAITSVFERIAGVISFLIAIGLVAIRIRNSKSFFEFYSMAELIGTLLGFGLFVCFMFGFVFCFISSPLKEKQKKIRMENEIVSMRNRLMELEKKYKSDLETINKLKQDNEELKKVLDRKLAKNSVSSVEEYYFSILEKC